MGYAELNIGTCPIQTTKSNLTMNDKQIINNIQILTLLPSSIDDAIVDLTDNTLQLKLVLAEYTNLIKDGEYFNIRTKYESGGGCCCCSDDGQIIVYGSRYETDAEYHKRMDRKKKAKEKRNSITKKK